MRNYLLSIACIAVFFICGNANAQTAGTFTVSLTTAGTGSSSAQTTTKHIEAIWVTTSAGVYIHTISYKAATRKQYLITYNAITGTTTTSTASPTSTGATISNGAESYTWNGQDNSGALVPDGNYIIYFELTDLNGLGKTATVNWTKGATATTSAAVSFAPSFNNIILKWVPSTSTCTNPTVSIAATKATVCKGSSTTLTASGTASTYAWSTTATSAAITVTPTTTTTYTVTGTSATGGCTSTASQVVTVNALPTVSISRSSASICNGATASLIASGATTYSWNNSIATANQTVTPTSTTTYTVTGTTNGCTNTATTSITVNTVPTVTISTSSQVICSGDGTTITASGATTYSWNNAIVTAAQTVFPTTTISYIVTGTTNGCTGTASTAITVNAKPTVIITPTSSTICQGIGTTITAIGASTYSWSNAIATAAQTVSPTNTTSYIVTGTTNGCSSTASTAITVNAIPTVIITPSSSSICQGIGTTITASGASTYLWNNAIATAAQTVSPTNTTNYIVTGTANGCVGTASTSITVNSKPTVIITPSSSSICQGIGTTITASGASSYSWNNAIATAAQTVSPSNTTSYIVTGTANGCSGTATTAITVNTKPTVIITPSSSSICIGTGTAITASGATTYSWNNSISTAVQTVSPSSTTSYIVTGTTNGCIGTASTVVTVNSLPTITATALPTAVCAGSTTSLGASGASSYSWSNGLTGASVTATPSANTTYFVTGTDANGCKAISSAKTTYTNPPLASGIDVSVTIGASVPALNATGTFVKWYNSTGTTVLGTGSSYTPSVSTASATSFPYKVTNTLNGCESPQITITLTVTSCIVTAPIVNTASQTKCAGLAFTAFTATGSNIKWYSSDQVTVLETGTSFTPNNAGDYYASQTNTCEGPKTKVSANTTALPTVGINASSTTICNGTGTTLTASGATSYTWDLGNATTSITVSPSANSTYSVTGTANGCSNTALQAITVNQLTTSTITTSATTSYTLNSTTYTSSGTFTQKQVNSVGCDSIITLNLTINTATNFTILTTRIQTAQSIHDNAVEGSANGQYPNGSKAILQAAIDDAIIVNSNVNATQLEVNIAIITIEDATLLFKSKIVVTNSSALNDAIISAQDVYTNSTEGLANGQYPAGSKTTLQNAIDAATAVKTDVNSSQAQFDAAIVTLNKAVSDFQALKITVNKTSLNTEITNGQTALSGTTEGTGNNQYPIGSKTTLQNAIDAASLVIANTGASQAQVDAAITTLQTAISTFQNSKIVVSKTALNSSITAAELVYSNSAEGTGNGQYPNGSKAILQSAIDVAITVNTDPSASQTQVDAAKTTLDKAVTDFQAKVIGVNKSVLNSEISNGQTALLGTTEGTGNNQYPVGSKTTLQNAIDAASLVSSNTNASQTQVDAAVLTLQTAISTFQNAKIVVTKTAFNSSITSAQLVYSNSAEGTGNGQYPNGSKAILQSAIDVAITVNTDPNASQAQVDAAKATLDKAVTDFQAKVIGVNKSILILEISNGQTALLGTSEGTGNNQYPVGSKTTLQNAIDAASLVSANTNASQIQVDAAVTALQSAISTFQNAKIIVNKTNLNSSISVAQTTYTNSTEGTADGQYQSGSKAILQSAIDAATVVSLNTGASQAQVDAAKTTLDKAVFDFKAKVVGVNKSVLNTEISNGQTALSGTIEGSGNNQYPVGSKTTVQNAIDVASALSLNTNASQSQVDAAVIVLQSAISTFKNSKITVNKSALNTTILSAQSVYTISTEGVADGQYPSGSKAVLQSAIDAASSVYADPNASQNQVDAGVTTLQDAIAAYQALKISVIKTALNTSITAAQTIYTNASEGTSTGQHPIGSKATLQTAINAANAVSINTNASQAQVDQAKLNIDAAVTLFQGTVITVLTDKIALIAKLDEAILLQTSVQSIGIGQRPTEYPTSAYNLFVGEMITSQTIIDNPIASQSDIDTELTKLGNAILMLKASVNPAANKGLLVNAITKADSLLLIINASTDYTPSVVNTFIGAIAAAKIIEQNPKATQAEVDAQTTSLENSIYTVTFQVTIQFVTDLHDVSTKPGLPTELKVVVKPSSAIFEWLINTGTGYVTIPTSTDYTGLTSSTLRIKNPTLLFNGYKYRCIAKVGSQSVTSSVATLSVITTSIKEETESLKTYIYPTIAGNEIKIVTNSLAVDQAISIINSKGAVVLKTTISGTETTVDVSNLASGIYIVTFPGSTEKGIQIIKE